MKACESIFMYEYAGWIFLAGENIEGLFYCQQKEENAVEKWHVEKLLKWGETFNDVQLYMHYDRSMYFNAFYRVLNGAIQYGEYYTETFEKKYGKIPKNVRDLPDNNANTIASEWSYDPDLLRFLKQTEDVKAWEVQLPD